MDLSHNMCSVLYEFPFMINRGVLRVAEAEAIHHSLPCCCARRLARLEWDIRGVSALCLGLAHPSPQAKHTEMCSRQLTTIKSTEEEEVLNTPLVSDASSSHWLSPLICSPPFSVAYCASEINTWMPDSESGWLISWVADFMANCVSPCCVFGALSRTCRHLALCCVLYSGHLAGCWAAE